jgi:hypothetical protein
MPAPKKAKKVENNQTTPNAFAFEVINDEKKKPKPQRGTRQE